MYFIPRNSREEQNETPTVVEIVIVDGSGGDLVWHFTKGRQALTGHIYGRTLYPVSGPLVGSPGSLLDKGAEQRSATELQQRFYRLSLPPWTGPPSRRMVEAGTLSKSFLNRYRDCWLQPGPRGKAALAGATSVVILYFYIVMAQVSQRRRSSPSEQFLLLFVCFRLSSK